MKKILISVLLLTFCLSTTIFAAVADISNISITKAINQAKKLKEEKTKISKDFESQIKTTRESLIKQYNKQTKDEMTGVVEATNNLLTSNILNLFFPVF